MTADQWLDGVLGRDHPLLRVATTQYMAEEYGLDPTRLSAINMVMEFAGGGLPSDERFHVRGGNDQLVSGLVDRLPDGTVVRDAPLNRLVRSRAGGYRLGFASGPDAAADVVVLCAPFSALRHSDLDGSGLSKRKLSCIRSLGMGTNAKVLLQLDRRVTDYGATPARHWTGGYYDARVDTWDSSAAEGGGPACSRSTPAATSERRTLPARHMVRHRGTSSQARWPRSAERSPISRAGTPDAPGSTRGSTTPTRVGPTPPSSPASSPATGASSASPSTTSTSPASTRRAAPSASSTERSRVAVGRLARFSPGSDAIRSTATW